MSHFALITVAQNIPKGTILGVKHIKMSYEFYDQDIVSRHKVKLNGWPAGLSCISPSKINSVDEIRSLRDALKAGDCMWSKISTRQHEAHIQSLKDRIAADPSLARPPRKTRTDKRTASGPKKKALSQSKGKRADGGKRKCDDKPETSESEEDTREPRSKKAKWPALKKASAVKGKLPPLARSRSTIPTSDNDDDE